MGMLGNLEISGGASGGSGSVTHTAGNLTANELVIGNGVADLKTLGTLGTVTTILHGNAAGAPTFGAVVLTTDVSGDLPFANLVPATAISVLVGRGAAAGAGDFQEITLGANLTMTGTVLSAAGGSGSPGGSDTQVQFNDATAFGGVSTFTWNKTTLALSVDGSAVFNDSGADKDFRVEGDTQANLFFVDASTDRIGIGTSTPIARLQAVAGLGSFQVGSGAGGNIYAYVSGDLGSANGPGFFADVTGDAESRAVLQVNTAGLGELSFGSGSGARDIFLVRTTAHTLVLRAENAGQSVLFKPDKLTAGFIVSPQQWGDSSAGLGRLTYTVVGGDPAIAANAGKGFTLYTDDGNVEAMTFASSGAVVFNEGGASVDFRIEGDTQANLFFLDASTDRIGIGTATVPSLLTVNGLINTKNYTVATLPAGTRGDIAYVTDALAPAFLAVVVGGGAVVAPVFYNGANWVGF